ncbi:MAG: hypothetical protein WD738_10570 [Pirellulales bacterium]
MSLRRRIVITVALASIAIVVNPDAASAQISLSFGGDSDDDDRHDDGGRHRDRDSDDDHQNGIQFRGSKAKQFQQLIEGGQPDAGAPRRRGQGPQFQGQQFHDSDDWHSQKGDGHRDSQNWIIEFGGSTPFSARWYNDHPNAWRHHHRHHDHDDDAWKIATAAGVLRWLGWGTAVQGGPVVVYDSPTVETVVVDPNLPGEWMTLGAYSLLTGPGDSGTRMLELAVDKHGFIGGNYYDMISGASFNVTGRIDRKTQRATWSLESNQQLTFSAPLNQLTEGQGLVDVKFPSGRTQQWRLVRMENAAR